MLFPIKHWVPKLGGKKSNPQTLPEWWLNLLYEWSCLGLFLSEISQTTYEPFDADAIKYLSSWDVLKICQAPIVLRFNFNFDIYSLVSKSKM